MAILVGSQILREIFGDSNIDHRRWTVLSTTVAQLKSLEDISGKKITNMMLIIPYMTKFQILVMDFMMKNCDYYFSLVMFSSYKKLLPTATATDSSNFRFGFSIIPRLKCTDTIQAF